VGDVFVVASTDDALAQAFVRACDRRGHSAEILDVDRAARRFTIAVDDGVVRVEPEAGLFLRIPPPPAIRPSFDEAFLSGECFAMLFAAAALGAAPVVNPPYRGSLNGRLTHSSAVTALRVGAGPVTQEVFASSVPEPPGEGPAQSWCVQDLSTFGTATWPFATDGGGPFRARWADADRAYEMIVVLDATAWRTSRVDLRALRLESRSVDLVARLGLRFAVVTWAVSASLEAADVARVDPYPSLAQVRPVWPEVGEALVTAFFP
jgi:hypothetical protein